MRLYDEKEIGEILRRTTELSKSVSRRNADGLSLEELQELASEAGLDPELVVQAAAELNQGPAPTEGFDLFGGPLTYTSYHDLGIEVDAETWEQMLPVIREQFNDPGVVSTRSGVYEWTGSSSSLESASSHVSCKKKPGGTQLHIIWSENASAIPFFIPTLIGFILSGVFIFEEFALGFEGVPIWIGITGLLFMLCRLGVIAVKKNKVKRIKALENRISQIALQEQNAANRRALKAAEEELHRVTEASRDAQPSLNAQESSGDTGPSLTVPDDEYESTTDSGSPVRERE